MLRHVTSAAFLAAACLTAPASAQQPQRDSQVAAAQIRRAERLEADADSAAKGGERRGREHAMALYDSASALFESAGALPKAAQALIASAVIAGDLTTIDSAFKLQRRALQLSTAAGDDTTRALALSEIGISFATRMPPDSAFNYFAQSLAIRHRLGLVGPEAETLANFGAVFLQQNHPDSAALYLARALPLLEQAHQRDTYEQTLYNVARLALQVGRPDSAIATQRRVIPIADSVKDFHTVAEAHLQIGTAFEMRWRESRSRIDVDSALANYLAAYQIIKSLGEPSTEAIILNDIGLAERRLQNPGAALSYYDSARAIHRRLNDRRSEGEVLQNIGIVLGGDGHAAAALDTLLAALAVHREVGDTAWEWMALKELGNLFQHESLPRDLPRAAAYYDSAAQVLSTLTAEVGANADQLTFEDQQYNYDLFEQWTLAELDRTPAVGADEAARRALRATESGRARTLLSLITRRSPGAETVSVSDTRIGNHLALSYLVTRDTLVVWLQKPGGHVLAVREHVSADSLAALVSDLRRAMGVEPNTSVLAVDPARARQLLEVIATIVLPPTFVAAIPAGSELAIVPDGPLTLLPFAALPVRGGEYAGIRWALRYAPSLATLAALDESATSRDRSEPSVATSLVVGDPRMPKPFTMGDLEFTLDSLPYAADEARAVAATLHTHALIDTLATEAEVVERLPSARVIHLATHGVAFSAESQVRSSFIALAPGDGKTGVLTLGEILDSLPRLHAELVVLSACQTALGNLSHAEGTVGFQRAFIAKGAQGVLVSLWSINDQSTAQLMTDFYKYWQNGAGHRSKAEALRRAQRDMQSGTFRDPQYWAAFQLVGGDR